MPDYPRIAAMRTAEAFAKRLQDLQLDLGFDAEMETGAGAPLAQTYRLRSGFTVGNRLEFAADALDAAEHVARKHRRSRIGEA